MGHSEFSAKFIRALENYIWTFGHEIVAVLDQRWSSEDDSTSAEDLMDLDLIKLQLFFTGHGKAFNYRQMAFLADLRDLLAERKDSYYCEFSVNDHLEIYHNTLKSLSEESFKQSPTDVIRCLVPVDILGQTNYAAHWKQFLINVADVMLFMLGHEQSVERDKKIFAKLDLDLTEALTWEKPAEYCFFEESPELIKSVRLRIEKLLVPLYEMANSNPQIGSQLKDPSDWFENSLVGLILGLMKVDGIVKSEELQLLCDLGPTLGLYGYSATPHYLRKIISGDQQSTYDPSCVSSLVYLFEIYDQACGTNYAEDARQLVLSLVNAFFEIDMDVCSEEKEWLEKCHKELYPHSKQVGEDITLKEAEKKSVVFVDSATGDELTESDEVDFIEKELELVGTRQVSVNPFDDAGDLELMGE